MPSSYCICFPHDEFLYVETPDFDILRNLLLTQRFRGNAHFRTVDGYIPYLGGGIIFPFYYLRLLGVQPLWYLRKGRDYQKALIELVEDGIYTDELEADEFHGYHYPKECEWLGPSGMRFDLDFIEAVWIGPVKDNRMMEERADILEGILPQGTPIFLEVPEPSGVIPC